MSFQDKIDLCHDFNQQDFLPFIIDQQNIGYIKKTNLPSLKKFSDYFTITDQYFTFIPRINDFDKRSAALKEVSHVLQKQGFLKASYDENYNVKAKWESPAFCEIPRSSCVYFGTRAFGIHVNGIVKKTDGLYMWIAKRAGGKVNFPHQLDQIVAGGQPNTLTLQENLEKEAMEEASIPKSFCAHAKQVSRIRYKKQEEYGLRNDTIFVYDLELPTEFVPKNTDGEVESFSLMRFEEVLKIVKTSFDFKFNCNLVILDFAQRHGYID